YRHDQSISYENRYTRLTYQYDEGKIDKMAQAGSDEELMEDVKWLSYRQHFFSSIMVSKEPIKRVNIASEDLVANEDIDTIFTKQCSSKCRLIGQAGEISQSLNVYFGRTDSKLLKKYDDTLVESIPFCWGIFGWINKALVIPLFGFLSGSSHYGIGIVVMTIL